MRIALIRPSSFIISLKNYNSQEIGLAEALLDYKTSTDIFIAGNVSKPLHESINKKNGNNVRLFQLPFIKLPGRQAFFPSLFKILKQEEYDLIQVHEDSHITSCIVSMYGKKRRIPVILCQGMYKNYSGTIAKLLQIIYDLTFLRIFKKNIAASIAKTKSAKAYLRSKGFKNISVCPTGLNIKQFKDEEVINWRNKYNISAKAKIILYVGIIEPRRNVDFIIKLFSELLKKGQNVYLFIAGHGPNENECKQIAENLYLNGRIIFLEKIPQAQLPSLYKNADVLLLPSSYEIYGMVMLEAMYFGIPVITTSTAGSSEIIESDKNGIIIQEIELDEWLAIILKLLSNRSLLDSISFEAFKRIKERFLWDKASIKYFEVYQKVLQTFD